MSLVILVLFSRCAFSLIVHSVYRKWNSSLFEERLKAYKSGLIRQDPSLTWYQEQLNFFDNVAVPLSQKLCDCGMFGEFSNEYLSYARMNRDEWQRKGQKETCEILEQSNGSSSSNTREGSNHDNSLDSTGNDLRETTETPPSSHSTKNQGLNVTRARAETSTSADQAQKKKTARVSRSDSQNSLERTRDNHAQQNLTTIMETADEASKSVSTGFSGDTTILSVLTPDHKDEIPHVAVRPRPDDADGTQPLSSSHCRMDRAESPTPSIPSVASDNLEQPGLNFMSYDKMMSNSIRRMAKIEEPKPEEPAAVDQMDQPEQPGIRFVSRSQKMVDTLGRVNEPIYGPELNIVSEERPMDPLFDGRTEMGQQRALDMALDEESTISSWRPINDAPVVNSTRNGAAAKDSDKFTPNGPSSSSFYLGEILGENPDETGKSTNAEPSLGVLGPVFSGDASIISDDSSTVVSV